MAMVRVKNNRECDLTLAFVAKNGEVVQATIPGARQDPDDRNKLIPGSELVDDSLIEQARKKPVCDGYFNEGWLTVVKDDPAPQSADDDTGNDKKGGGK